MLRRKSLQQQVNSVLVLQAWLFLLLLPRLRSLSPLASVFSDFSAIKICYMESVEMDQRVKAPATKSDSLSSIPQNPYDRRKESTHKNGPLTSTRPTHIRVHTQKKYIHVHTQKKYTNSSLTSTRHTYICVHTQKKYIRNSPLISTRLTYIVCTLKRCM